ncbi:hypothetical protein D3C72_1349870 [compost metagenome]
MGGGHAELGDQHVGEDRFQPANRVDALAGLVGFFHAGGQLAEVGQHGDRGGAFGQEMPPGGQECFRFRHVPRRHTRLPHANAAAERPVGQVVAHHVDAVDRAHGIGRVEHGLEGAFGHGLDRPVDQQPDAVGTDGAQGGITREPGVEHAAFDVPGVGRFGEQVGGVEGVGVGDQAIAHPREHVGHGRRVAGEAADGGADARRDQVDDGEHARAPSITRSSPSTAVTAQRNGAGPSAARARVRAGKRAPAGRRRRRVKCSICMATSIPAADPARQAWVNRSLLKT